MSIIDASLTEAQKILQETARRFAREEILPHSHEWEEAGEFPRELYEKAGSIGLLGVGFPEELGGVGGGALEILMSIEGLMEGMTTGVTVGLGSHQIALPPVVEFGSDPLRRRIVDEVLRGEKIAALAITEPGAGSDVAGITTRATRRDDGSYRINGAKTFITSGVRADYLTVLTRTSDDKHGGLTFFVVERDREGLSISKPLKKTGWWSSDTAELGFDDVVVPEENRLGAEGTGFLALMKNFQLERLALAGYGYTTAALALRLAREYVEERRAFGRPLKGFQVLRHRLADMATKTLAARVLTFEVARAIDRGESCFEEVAMAKNLTAETAVAVTYDAVQIFGGAGYMRETVVERLSRDARLLPIGGGTQEIMKEIISRQMGLV